MTLTARSTVAATPGSRWTALCADRARTRASDDVSFAVHLRKRERRPHRRGLHQLLPRKVLRCPGGLAHRCRAYRNIGYASFLHFKRCCCRVATTVCFSRTTFAPNRLSLSEFETTCHLLTFFAVGARWFGGKSAQASDFSIDGCQTVTLAGNRSVKVYNNANNAKCQVHVMHHHCRRCHNTYVTKAI